MSRLKFRAWSEELKIMADFYLIDILANSSYGQYLIIDDQQIMLYLKNCKIMQYLGEDCSDKNGKEYCEDDLIKIPEFKKDTDLIGKILYRRGLYRIQDIYTDAICSFHEIFVNCWNDEIIGNIHQNPGALEMKYTPKHTSEFYMKELL